MVGLKRVGLLHLSLQRLANPQNAHHNPVMLEVNGSRTTVVHMKKIVNPSLAELRVFLIASERKKLMFINRVEK